MIYISTLTGQERTLVRCPFCGAIDWGVSDMGRKPGVLYLKCNKCKSDIPFQEKHTHSTALNVRELRVLEAAKANDLWWSRREGGSENYQRYRKEVHQLVKAGFLVEFSKSSCCNRQYILSKVGEAFLANKLTTEKKSTLE